MLIWNSFRHVYPTTALSNGHVVNSSFWKRLTDTFYVFYGYFQYRDLPARDAFYFESQAGLFDHLLLELPIFIRNNCMAAYHQVLNEGNKTLWLILRLFDLNKWDTMFIGLGEALPTFLFHLVAMIVYGLLDIALSTFKAIPAAIITILLSPILFAVHSSTEEERELNDDAIDELLAYTVSTGDTGSLELSAPQKLQNFLAIQQSKGVDTSTIQARFYFEDDQKISQSRSVLVLHKDRASLVKTTACAAWEDDADAEYCSYNMKPNPGDVVIPVLPSTYAGIKALLFRNQFRTTELLELETQNPNTVEAYHASLSAPTTKDTTPIKDAIDWVSPEPVSIHFM